MNSNALADSRIPLLYRVSMAADLLHVGTGPLCMVVSSSHAEEGWTEAYIVGRALELGWSPTPPQPGDIDPRRWLSAVSSAVWAPSATRNAALRALDGQLMETKSTKAWPVQIIALAPSDVCLGTSKAHDGIATALAAGWQPSAEQITAALSFDPSLVERWPVMSRFLKG